MLSIKAVNYFVPSKRLKISESLERFSLNKVQAKIYSTFYGLDEIPCAEDLSITTLLQKPIDDLLENTSVQKQQIKYVIHAHTASVITEFGNSVIRDVANKTGLNNAMVFGTSLNNCAATLNAFEIAEALLNEHDETAKALIITGERAFTPTVQVIPNTSITGDAAAVALVSLHGKRDRMIHLEMKTAGQFHRGIWLTPEETRQFEKEYVPLLSSTIVKATKSAGLELQDIKLILPHNVNLISWEKTAKELGFPFRNIFLDNVKKYAHCFGSDILINYADVQNASLLSPGDYYIMATVGLGATFAVAVFQH